MKKYVMDSYAMIAFFEDEEGADKVGKILNVLMTPLKKGYIES